MGQRAHNPHALGPRVELRGRFYTLDGRPWGKRRYHSLLNPSARGWPLRGERTTSLKVATTWALAYRDLWNAARSSRQLGQAETLPLDLEDAVLAFLRQLESENVAENTYRNYASLLQGRLLRFARGAKRARSDLFDPEDAKAFLLWLRKEGLAQTTIHNNYRRTLARFMRFLGYEKPYANLRPPRVTQTEPRYFHADEVTALFDAARDSERLLLAALLGTGAREGEVCTLKWTRFDPKMRTVRIVDQANSYRKVVPTKGRKVRTTLVLPVFWEYWRENARGYIFEHADGGPIGPYSVMHALHRLYDRLGMRTRGLSAHVWRHTYAHQFMDLTDGDLGLLCESLGDTYEVVDRTYRHFGGDRAAKLAYAKVYGCLGPRLA